MDPEKCHLKCGARKRGSPRQIPSPIGTLGEVLFDDRLLRVGIFFYLSPGQNLRTGAHYSSSIHLFFQTPLLFLLLGRPPCSAAFFAACSLYSTDPLSLGVRGQVLSEALCFNLTFYSASMNLKPPVWHNIPLASCGAVLTPYDVHPSCVLKVHHCSLEDLVESTFGHCHSVLFKVAGWSMAVVCSLALYQPPPRPPRRRM